MISKTLPKPGKSTKNVHGENSSIIKAIKRFKHLTKLLKRYGKGRVEYIKNQINDFFAIIVDRKDENMICELKWKINYFK